MHILSNTKCKVKSKTILDRLILLANSKDASIIWLIALIINDFRANVTDW